MGDPVLSWRVMARLPAALLAFAALCLPALGAEPARESFRLENGLRVTLKPVEGSRQAAIIVLFDIGGLHDPEGRSGLAHYVEHLYVTAAAGKIPARTADEFFLKYDRQANAQTGDDYTVAAGVFPAERLAAEIAEAASRMGDLKIEQADLDRELPRLLQELSNMYGGIPALAAMNHARERLSPTPAKGRKGGVPDHLKTIGIEDLRDRWKRLYKPANARLILAGGFDPKEARRAIEGAFGPIPAGEPAPRPAEVGKGIFELARIVTEPLPIQGAPAGAVAQLAFRAPPPASADYAPFLVLASRLTAGHGIPVLSRGPTACFAPLDEPTVLLLSAPLSKEETPEQAVARLDAEVRGRTERKLAKGEHLLVHQTYGAMLGISPGAETLFRGNLYGLAFSAGRRDQLGIDPERIRKGLETLTEEDLRRVAASVFAPERRAAVFVAPKSSGR